VVGGGQFRGRPGNDDNDEAGGERGYEAGHAGGGDASIARVDGLHLHTGVVHDPLVRLIVKLWQGLD